MPRMAATREGEGRPRPASKKGGTKGGISPGRGNDAAPPCLPRRRLLSCFHVWGHDGGRSKAKTSRSPCGPTGTRALRICRVRPPTKRHKSWRSPHESFVIFREELPNRGKWGKGWCAHGRHGDRAMPRRPPPSKRRTRRKPKAAPPPAGHGMERRYGAWPRQRRSPGDKRRRRSFAATLSPCRRRCAPGVCVFFIQPTFQGFA